MSTLVLLTTAAGAQYSALTAHPRARILSKVDRHVRHSIPGTHPMIVDRATQGSRISADTQFKNMVLVLEPSDEQKAALKSLLDAQQDKTSASYHKWLTPDTFAASFGVASSDISQVTAWLADSGLKVENVSRTGRFVTFSGTAGSVEAAFGTELHKVSVDGEVHISNTTDVSVPSALASVIRGVARLNNFNPKPLNTGSKKVTVPVTANASGTPLFTGGGGTHYVGAGDIAKIYNAQPLYDQGIDGTGVSISVIAQSNIQLADVQSYRSLFGLPKNDPTIIVLGSDPGENGDDLEAFLDAELAGSIAKNAHVNFVTAPNELVGNQLAGGIDSSALYIVDNNLGDIITMSYGGCEVSNGASGANFWNILWEIAAAQGQTVFVSSGDSGASTCASSSATSTGANGYGVNALGSSNYNVSVGGTMFVDYGPSAYWGTNPQIPYTTALGYIPEAALNQGRLSTTQLNDAATATVTTAGIFAGGGGISVFNSRPAWQTGSGIVANTDVAVGAGASGNGLPPNAVAGSVPAPHRLVPDVSFISAYGHDGTLMCGEGSCAETPAGGFTSAIIIGGTSVAAPAMASVQALINAANGGGRQGNANYHYYALANQQYAASTTACKSLNGTAAAPTVTLPASTCNFNDTVAGSIIVPTAASGTAGIGFSAGTGYDAATGLGSPNIANLAHNWNTVSFNSTTTTLSITPTTAAHGTNQTALIQVTSGAGTPTGDVSIVASGAQGIGGFFTLSNGSVNGLLTTLPGGTYNVYAHYDGNGTFAASDSAPVSVTITKEGSVTASSIEYLTTGGGLGSINPNVNYGVGQIDIATSIAAASNVNNGVPTGTVTYSVTRNGSPLPSIVTTVDGEGLTYLSSGPSIAAYYLVANYPVLAAGAYSITATYSGDNSFNGSSATTSFNVVSITPAVSFTAGSANITSGATASLNFTVTTASAGSFATGTVTFTDTTTSTVLGTASLTRGRALLTTNALTTAGAHSIQAVYSGDNNYKTVTPASVNVTVGSQTATTTTVTNSVSPTVGATVTLTGTVVPKPTAATPVYFYDGGVLLGSANAAAATGVANLNVTNFTGGAHTITATFAGTATQQSSTGSLALNVALRTTTITIGGGETSAYGQTISLNGTITRVGVATPTTAPVVPLTGLVNFYEGSTSGALLGSATPIFAPGVYAGAYVATLNTTTLSVGSHNIVAAYISDGNYAGSVSGTAPVTVSKASQTITFTGLPANATYLSAGPYTLSATATSGLAVTYGVSGPASLSGSTLTITGAGTVVVTASQAGNSNYNAATPVSQTIVVSKASQTISFTGLPANATYLAAGPYTLSGTATSGLPVSYSVTGPASLSGNTLTITGPGTVVVTASQAGNSNYNAATPVSQTIIVGKANQTISFSGLPATASYGGGAGPYALNGTASSGLPVSYSVSGPGTISGSTLTVTGSGTVVVTASQAGNANYNAATPVSQTIVVGTITVVATGTITRQGNGTYTVTVKVSNTGTGPASNVVLTSVLIGSVAGSPVPQSLGTITAGSFVTTTVTVPANAGTPGSNVVEKISGTYTGGTFGGSSRAQLP